MILKNGKTLEQEIKDFNCEAFINAVEDQIKNNRIYKKDYIKRKLMYVEYMLNELENKIENKRWHVK